jgi:hypothetical protein
VPAADIAGVRRVQWASHVRWLRDNFEAGQHIGVLTPTGGGKSYLAVEGLLKLPVIEHARVLMIDDKGRDRSTRTWGTPIAEYPLPLRARLRGREELPHWRLVVPEWTWSSTGSHTRGVDRARAVVGRALDAFYREAEDPADEGASDDATASVVVIDETYALTAPRPPSLNLAPLVINLWRKGRYRALSVIALSQEPAWLPGEFYSQPTHLYIGKILDARRQDRLREIGGDTDRIKQIVGRLDAHEFLFLGSKAELLSVVQVGR